MFVVGRGPGAPGVLARPRRRPGRPLARHGQPGRGLSRLPDAPRGEPGHGLRAGIRPGGAVRRPALDDRRASRSARGWTLLGLHNDCRYKAFFQRLKAATASYRVDGGSGGRPRPPAPWPRRGLAALDLAGVQGVRAPCRPDRLDRSGRRGDRCSRGSGWPLAQRRAGHGGPGPDAGDRADRPRGHGEARSRTSSPDGSRATRPFPSTRLPLPRTTSSDRTVGRVRMAGRSGSFAGPWPLLSLWTG